MSANDLTVNPLLLSTLTGDERVKAASFSEDSKKNGQQGWPSYAVRGAYWHFRTTTPVTSPLVGVGMA